MDFSYAIEGLARFRCSAYRHLGSAGIALRIVRGKIPTIAELKSTINTHARTLYRQHRVKGPDALRKLLLREKPAQTSNTQEVEQTQRQSRRIQAAGIEQVNLESLEPSFPSGRA